MESNGVGQCFQESEDFHKVRIINFIGDGNSVSFCRQRNKSWCKYQADIANEINTYVHKSGLPVYARDKIMHIFRDLN